MEAVRYTTCCYFHVRPGNRPAITGVALCHKEVGHPWYKYSNSLLAKLAFVGVTKCIADNLHAYSIPSAVLLSKILHASILGTLGAIAIAMYSFFSVIPRRLDFMYRRPGYSCLYHLWRWSRVFRNVGTKFRRRGIIQRKNTTFTTLWNFEIEL